MQDRKRLEEGVRNSEAVTLAVSDIETLFELAREGEDLNGDLEREIKAFESKLEELETGMLLEGEGASIKPLWSKSTARMYTVSYSLRSASIAWSGFHPTTPNARHHNSINYGSRSAGSSPGPALRVVFKIRYTPPSSGSGWSARDPFRWLNLPIPPSNPSLECK